MSVIQYFVTRHHRRSAYVDEYDDPFSGWWPVAFLCTLGLIIVSVLAWESQYEFRDSYEVSGTIVGYGTTSGKHKKTTVWIKHEHELLAYSTEVYAEECVRAPLGTRLPVTVAVTVHRWSGAKRKTPQLMFNPCKEPK